MKDKARTDLELDRKYYLLHMIRKACLSHGLIATEEMENEILFRCDSIEGADIASNIWACVMYALVNGFDALKNEEDDCNIWQFLD